MNRRHCLSRGLLLGLAWLGGPSAWGAGEKPIRVLAASDLKFVLTKIASRFQQETGQLVDLNFGSSGNYTRQLQQGLKADLFLSADEALVGQLVVAGLSRRVAGPSGEQADHGALYGRGRLVLLVPGSSDLALDPGLQGLMARWGQIHKFAIANPEHAPYGRAAREALEQLGLWQRMQSKLVLGENIAQATQYVISGAAQAGITALSLVSAPELARAGRYLVLPESLHQPLFQRMVLLKNASRPAVLFYDYLQSAVAREIFRGYGFVTSALP